MGITCRWTTICFVIVCLSTSTNLGCGSGEAELIPVTGVVKNADSSALAFESGMVIFQPTAGGKNASGNVEKDGTFTMMTQRPGDGVTPGTYKVLLQLWKSYRTQELAVPKKYGDGTTTPLEATVDEDHDEFEFTVEQ